VNPVAKIIFNREKRAKRASDNRRDIKLTKQNQRKKNKTNKNRQAP